jgi:hypothetical protein
MNQAKADEIRYDLADEALRGVVLEEDTDTETLFYYHGPHLKVCRTLYLDTERIGQLWVHYNDFDREEHALAIQHPGDGCDCAVCDPYVDLCKEGYTCPHCAGLGGAHYRDCQEV